MKQRLLFQVDNVDEVSSGEKANPAIQFALWTVLLVACVPCLLVRTPLHRVSNKIKDEPYMSMVTIRMSQRAKKDHGHWGSIQRSKDLLVLRRECRNEPRGPLNGNHPLDGFTWVIPILIPCISRTDRKRGAKRSSILTL